ncbi:hypothetical protein BGW36DRAFT_5972 [Talaromyces proteolyticus]|uniref:Chromo domain-containing protein n=1 Tax=Talaromyces proteolyticus TaxID=1131652 RepID=A0AAD4L1S4_9EURO|nr:uncharacterized protein BGW36DRAFT_5972 [Talaromyces proteolyticus]KAH8705036.1 hypothetical protein BGW36DRAFT_5972 [Talaromyces proteolyticus]
MSPDSSENESSGGSIPFESKKTQASDDEVSNSDEEEDVYVVEKIVDHQFKKNGALLLKVKWKGYDDPDDQTLEPVDGLLEGATEAVEEYFSSIGGRPQPPGKQGPGRKRKSLGEAKSTATPEPKKARKSRGKANGKDNQDTLAENNENIITADSITKDWLEKDVQGIETIVPDENENLYVYARFKDGTTAKIAIQQCYERMPMTMLKFYEAHLTFKG